MQYRNLSLALGLAIFLHAEAQVAAPPPGTHIDEPGQQEKNDPLAQIENAIEAKNYGAASNQLGIYLSAHPGDARALFDRGYIEDAQGQPQSAENYYRKAIAADPRQFESHLALGLILANRNDPAAREQLQAATESEPNPPNPAAKAQAYRSLARLLQHSDPEAASAALISALKLTPETPDDTLLTAEIAEASGQNDVAEQAYRRILATQPDSSSATAGLAHLLIAQKKYSDAEPLVQTALKRDPDNPALNTQLAAILAAENKQADALSVLEKLHQLQPADASIGTMLADAYVQQGDLDKASTLYDQLAKNSPSDPDLLSARGQLLVRQQRYPEAIATFQQVTKIKPDDADAWSGIAFSASETHQYQLQLDALTMRSKFAQDTAITYFLWATAYDNLHQTKVAADYYHKFLTAAQGKFPDQEWQAKHRLVALGK